MGGIGAPGIQTNSTNATNNFMFASGGTAASYQFAQGALATTANSNMSQFMAMQQHAQGQ